MTVPISLCVPVTSTAPLHPLRAREGLSSPLSWGDSSLETVTRLLQPHLLALLEPVGVGGGGQRPGSRPFCAQGWAAGTVGTGQGGSGLHLRCSLGLQGADGWEGEEG